MIRIHLSRARLVWLGLASVVVGCAVDTEENPIVAEEAVSRTRAVTLTSPANGATVSGTVMVKAAVSSRVSWVNFYVDGHYATSSPPYTYAWDSTRVADGAHTLHVEAKNTSGRIVGTASVTVQVENGASDAGTGGTGDAGTPGDAGGAVDSGGPGPTHFGTLAPHAALPDEATCAAWVNARPTPENIPDNATANATKPTAAWLSAFHANPINACGNDGWCPDLARVTGSFTGSTDMIIRWAACKWGIDEDVIRAEATDESNWHQSQLGDSDTVCHSRNVATGALNYWSEASPCKPSKGLLQIKLVWLNGYPYAGTSTPFNADFAYGNIRACMNGDQSYLDTQTSGPFGVYPPTSTDDALWGCVGRWFSGAWGDSGAVDYVSRVKSILANQGWPH
jgi:autotransporter family porin